MTITSSYAKEVCLHHGVPIQAQKYVFNLPGINFDPVIWRAGNTTPSTKERHYRLVEIFDEAYTSDLNPVECAWNGVEYVPPLSSHFYIDLRRMVETISKVSSVHWLIFRHLKGVTIVAGFPDTPPPRVVMLHAEPGIHLGRRRGGEVKPQQYVRIQTGHRITSEIFDLEAYLRGCFGKFNV